MDTIFQLPLFFLALLQLLVSLLLLAPKQIALPLAQVIKKARKQAATESVLWTVIVVLGGLFVACCFELMRGYERATRADVREMVHAIDYLRAQVSTVLCALNLLLLFLGRALAAALCAEDFSAKSLDALKRQVKGLQAAYEASTKSPAAGPAPVGGPPGMPSEAEALKRQLDRLISEKDALQSTVDAAVKARATAEASVVAMKSQMKGFDTHLDGLLEENKLLKRKLVGAGDQTYARDVASNAASTRKDD